MQQTRRWRLAAAAAATIVAGALAACGGDTDRPAYAEDGDTGAPAPATQRTLSPNPAIPDSTSGISSRTGRPGVAGDTLGSQGKAAGAPAAGATSGAPGRP